MVTYISSSPFSFIPQIQPYFPSTLSILENFCFNNLSTLQMYHINIIAITTLFLLCVQKNLVTIAYIQPAYLFTF